ncbi:type VI secretion system protein TssA [Xanthomonas sp. WHRI 1810A]|uniref:type VI secretion system protein TssA n=1 Tax=Xanthomonas sp. WHRI 1810A TaxID=3161565 RepID=UPI0032E89D32
MLDVLLLSAVSSSSPCGEDLEYDADFLQLARDAEGKPERTMGDAVQPAEPPQWQLIRQASHALLQRSKDLRIALYHVQSGIALDGIAGLAAGLALIHELLRQYWPGLYPQLDADDNDDPTARINALSALAGDIPLRLLGESCLTRSPLFGSISLRAAMNANGLQTVRDETLTADELAAALRSSDPESLRGVYSTLSQAGNAAEAIESCVSEHIGSAHGVDLSALKTVLRNALNILKNFGPDIADDSANEPFNAAAPKRLPTLATPSMSTEIATRDDVLHCLERVLDYYARHEPSSPLPVLLNRAKTLVHADFAAIVRNLIPDGVSQFENLRGPGAE